MYKYTHLYGHVKRKRMITVRQLGVAIGVSGSAEWFISSLRAFGQAVGQISRVVHVSVRAPFVRMHAYACLYMYMHACKCMQMHACTSICMPMRYACICEHMHAYISSIGSLQGHCILWPWSYLSLVLFSIYLKPACIVGNSDGAIAVGCRGAAMLVQSIGVSAHL